MLTLFLLRHAKSSWEDTSLDDYDRPLNARGQRSAPAVGKYLVEKGYLPDLILCSGARRTRETLGLIVPYLDGDLRIRVEEALYRAHDGEALLQRLQAVDARARSVMLIGHNPAMQDLFTALATGGDPLALERLAAKFPTAALAVLSSEATSWRDIAMSGATVTDHALPRDLLQE